MGTKGDLARVARRLDELAADVARIARDFSADETHRRPTTARNVLTIPFYFVRDPDRREITRRVFEHYRRISIEHELAVIGVGSEGEISRELFSSVFGDDVGYREFPQTWTKLGGAGSAALRVKFDETVRAARVHDPERVFIVGSDDVLSTEFFRAALASSADLVGIGSGPAAVRIVRLARRHVYLWDGSYSWAPDVTLCGGGVAIGRTLLDEWRFAPFALDGDEIGIERRARREGATVEAVPPGGALRFYAVKAERAVLNGWTQVARAGAVRGPSTEFAAFSNYWRTLG